MGEIFQVKSRENFEFQWYGSPALPAAHRSILPGWVDPVDNKGYYAKKRPLCCPPAWTNVDTATELGVNSILIRPVDVLKKDGESEYEIQRKSRKSCRRKN